jgi:hypothetical protein
MKTITGKAFGTVQYSRGILVSALLRKSDKLWRAIISFAEMIESCLLVGVLYLYRAVYGLKSSLESLGVQQLQCTKFGPN